MRIVGTGIVVSNMAVVCYFVSQQQGNDSTQDSLSTGMGYATWAAQTVRLFVGDRQWCPGITTSSADLSYAGRSATEISACSTQLLVFD